MISRKVRMSNDVMICTLPVPFHPSITISSQSLHSNLKSPMRRGRQRRAGSIQITSVILIVSITTNNPSFYSHPFLSPRYPLSPITLLPLNHIDDLRYHLGLGQGLLDIVLTE